jgi:hypothetical protein
VDSFDNRTEVTPMRKSIKIRRLDKIETTIVKCPKC